MSSEIELMINYKASSALQLIRPNGASIILASINKTDVKLNLSLRHLLIRYSSVPDSS